MLLIPMPGIEALIALRYRNLWPAQEVLGWINWQALEDRSEKVGGRHPSNRRQMEEWLDRHPEGSVPATSRAGILLLSGGAAEGRRVIANLPVANLVTLAPQPASQRRQWGWCESCIVGTAS
jgi:hypothetical protein